MTSNSTSLSEEFLEAFEFTFNLHKDQVRKGSEIPYMSHLMGVTALVLEDGGNETEAIAALLHDSVEDQGGLATLKIIQRKFGNGVAGLVEFCTDSMETPKPPWKDRKLAVINKVSSAGDSEYKIMLADKLHNLRTIKTIAETSGNDIWERFTGGHEGSLWYYRQLLSRFQLRGDHPYLREIEAILDYLEAIS